MERINTTSGYYDEIGDIYMPSVLGVDDINPINRMAAARCSDEAWEKIKNGTLVRADDGTPRDLSEPEIISVDPV